MNYKKQAEPGIKNKLKGFRIVGLLWGLSLGLLLAEYLPDEKSKWVALGTIQIVIWPIWILSSKKESVVKP